MPKLLPTRPFLILMYGYPGAGKTFFARQLSENLQAAHVQADRIRSELFEEPRYDKEENLVVSHLSQYMVEEFLGAGVSVIYDTNAMRSAQRRSLRDIARRAKAEVILIWFQIDADTAYARAAKRDRRRADDRFAAEMTRDLFDRLLGGMQNPDKEDYVVISGKHTFGTQLSAITKRLRELSIVGAHEASSKVIKPGLVNLIPNAHAGRVDLSRRNILIR